jgi:hypothetical protein
MQGIISVKCGAGCCSRYCNWRPGSHMTPLQTTVCGLGNPAVRKVAQGRAEFTDRFSLPVRAPRSLPRRNIVLQSGRPGNRGGTCSSDPEMSGPPQRGGRIVYLRNEVASFGSLATPIAHGIVKTCCGSVLHRWTDRLATCGRGR